MKRLLIAGIVGVMLFGGVSAARAQSSADSYFHEGAQQYVAGNEAAARRAVQQGLAVAPSDPRLLALRQKLRQRGRLQSRQDRSGSDSKDQSKEGNRDSDEQSSGGQEPQRPDRSEASQTGQGEESDSRSERRDGVSGERTGSGSTEASPVESMQAGRGGQPVDTLSRGQAERLLRALEGQERQLLRQLRTRSAERRRVEKDW